MTPTTPGMELTRLSKVVRLTTKGNRLLDLGSLQKSRNYRRFSVCSVLQGSLDDLLDPEERKRGWGTRERNWDRYGGERDPWEFKGHVPRTGKKDWSNVSVLKNIYLEHEAVKEMPEDRIEQFLEENNVKTFGDLPKPVLEIDHINFPDEIRNNLFRHGIHRPTPIQSLMWPIALSGMDSVGIAQTGSGKTLGYIIPAILHAMNQETFNNDYQRNARALVVAPTRELTQQISSVSTPFLKPFNMRAMTLYGGTSKSRQLQAISYGQDIIVATPGRLIDVLRDCQDLLHHVSYLVIDEADRMLDMGFEPQLDKIMEYLNPERQTTMWSATWPTEVQNLAQSYMTDNVQVQIGHHQLTVNDDIQQEIIVVEDDLDKLHKFVDVMKPVVDDPHSKVLIFTNTKDKASRLAFKLKRALGKPIDAIHGDVSQVGREKLLRDFRSGRMPILVATDVAARGIDVSDITHVVNFDFPRDMEDYIHRVGRTGRAGRKGMAISFFCPNQTPRLTKKLIKLLREHRQTIPGELEVHYSGRREFERIDTNRKYTRYAIPKRPY